ncbi:inactive protein tyrosine kinase pTKL [Vigna umbellata]|uniref:inactive protein tyrosine kinase pTKL n=1 Tax=Vigna umbellata TaxID=87088 RepID=UPI001F5E5AB5|nr:inactive protein tyrosine kinase pTKL [Vigna umbellata]
MVKEIETLTEDERRALRGSKFAPLPRTSSSKPRLAHPGGPLATNKAAALAKFLERKLKDPNGLASINPDLLELAVNNAKQTVHASGTSNFQRTIRHVDSFGDFDSKDSSEDELNELSEVKECKRKKKKKEKKKKEKKKNKKRKNAEVLGCAVMKKPKQKFKF